MNNFSKPHVVLADDDEDDRLLFKEAIVEVSSEIDLTTVNDGEQLMELLYRDEPKTLSVIFLDLNMPCKNGKECLKEIRKTKKLAAIPVIIFSTSSSEIDIDETYKMGANLYLEKPVLWEDLVKCLHTALRMDWSKYAPHVNKEHYIFRCDEVKSF